MGGKVNLGVLESRGYDQNVKYSKNYLKNLNRVVYYSETGRKQPHVGILLLSFSHSSIVRNWVVFLTTSGFSLLICTMMISVLVLKIIVEGKLDIKGNKGPGLSAKQVTNKWLFTIIYNCYLLKAITVFQHVVQALYHSVLVRENQN